MRQKLIKTLEAEHKLPVAVFVFSRAKCEQFAHGMPKLDLLDAKDKSKIEVFAKTVVESLNPADQALPQVRTQLRTHAAL